MNNSEMNGSELNGHAPETTALIRQRGAESTTQSMVLKLGTGEEEGAGGLSMGVLWESVRQRLKVALPLGIVLSAVSCAALYYFTEPDFRSVATLHIKYETPYIAFKVTSYDHHHYREFADTQLETMRGSYLISKA